MIFNDEIDRSLFLILSFDIRYREQIAKLIYNIPKDLIERIQNVLSDMNNDVSKTVELNKAFRDDDDITSMYKVIASNDSLRIKLSRWNSQYEEDIYDIDLGYVCLDKDFSSILFKNNDLLYLGSYFFSSSRLFLGIGPMVSKGNGVGYNLFDNMNGDYVVEIDSNKICEKRLNLQMIPNEIFLEDLSNKKNINRLVRKKGNSKNDFGK